MGRIPMGRQGGLSPDTKQVETTPGGFPKLYGWVSYRTITIATTPYSALGSKVLPMKP